MSKTTLRQLLEAGVHFGHQTSRWNPKMKPYIFTARNGVHILDLQQTQKRLDEACDFVRDTVAVGGRVLFVGTKKQAQDAIQEACKTTGHHHVTHRWMGGMLTNFAVIQKRLEQLKDLREMKTRGDFERMGNKEANSNIDKLVKLEANFSGMVEMKKLPAALFVVDCKKEKLAVAEAARLKIPVIAIADSNVNPDDVTYVIPGNDDAIRSVRLIVERVAEAIVEGNELSSQREVKEQQEQAELVAAAEAERVLLEEEAKAKEQVETEEEIAAAVATEMTASEEVSKSAKTQPREELATANSDLTKEAK